MLFVSRNLQVCFNCTDIASAPRTLKCSFFDFSPAPTYMVIFSNDALYSWPMKVSFLVWLMRLYKWLISCIVGIWGIPRLMHSSRGNIMDLGKCQQNPIPTRPWFMASEIIFLQSSIDRLVAASGYSKVCQREGINAVQESSLFNKPVFICEAHLDVMAQSFSLWLAMSLLGTMSTPSKVMDWMNSICTSVCWILSISLMEREVGVSCLEQYCQFPPTQLNSETF